MNLKTLLAISFVFATTVYVRGDVFSQAGPGTFDSETPLISQVNFSDDELIVDLDVKITGLAYPWAGDLVLSLTSPLGSKIDLVRRLGKSDFESATDSGNSIDFGGDYTFSDDGASLIAVGSGTLIPAGDYFPITAGGLTESLIGTFGNESTAGTWTLLVEDFDEMDSGAITGWSITAKSAANPNCDFNSDGVCSILDLDALYGVGDLELGVVSDATNSAYDIYPDGRIDSFDLNLWLGAAAHRDGFAQGYRRGDIDLNGTIEFADFLALSTGFGSGQLWGEGNPRGSGVTEFGDFLALSEGFGQTLLRKSAPAASVPEPTDILLPGILLAILYVRKRAAE